MIECQIKRRKLALAWRLQVQDIELLEHELRCVLGVNFLQVLFQIHHGAAIHEKGPHVLLVSHVFLCLDLAAFARAFLISLAVNEFSLFQFHVEDLVDEGCST